VDRPERSPKRILVTSNVEIARPPRSRIGLAASGACPRSNLWPRRWGTTVFSQLRERRGARSAARSLRTSFYPAGHLLQRPSARGARRNCALSLSGRRLAALNLAKLKQIAKTSAVLGQHLPNSCARTVRAIISGDLPPEGRERSTRCRPNTTRRLSEYVAQGPDGLDFLFEQLQAALDDTWGFNAHVGRARTPAGFGRWNQRLQTRPFAIRQVARITPADVAGCRLQTAGLLEHGGVDVYEVRKLKTLKTENSAGSRSRFNSK
jgi:hypothetical protein